MALPAVKTAAETRTKAAKVILPGVEILIMTSLTSLPSSRTRHRAMTPRAGSGKGALLLCRFCPGFSTRNEQKREALFV
jgi:hypothetical protein